MATKRHALIKRREAVGHTQETLAAAMDVDRTTVGRWESGRAIPRPWMRPKLARQLRVNADQLDKLLAPEPSAVPSAVPPPHPKPETSLRVSLVQAVATDSAESALFINFASATNVDTILLEQLDADVSRLALEYVSKPLPDLVHQIGALRSGVFELLRGRQRPHQTIRLYLTAGRLSGLATHVALDLGHYAVAATHARTAWLCAESADHDGMRAWVRSAQSLIAYWQRDYALAAHLASAGMPFADGGTIGARLLSLQARAAAALGDGPAALRAIEAAADARTGPGLNELPGIFSFPEAKQWTYAGTALLALNSSSYVGRAIAASTRAIALYEGAPSLDQSSGDLLAGHLDLANAYLARGDGDAAQESLTAVLTASPDRYTASIARRLNTLSNRLSSPVYSGSSLLSGLRENVREACSRPALTTTPEPSP